MIFDAILVGGIVDRNMHLIVHQEMHPKVHQKKGWISRRVERCLAE